MKNQTRFVSPVGAIAESIIQSVPGERSGSIPASDHRSVEVVLLIWSTKTSLRKTGYGWIGIEQLRSKAEEAVGVPCGATPRRAEAGESAVAKEKKTKQRGGTERSRRGVDMRE